MEPPLPQLFGRLPKSKLVVTSVPEFMEKDSSTNTFKARRTGSRKGQVWVMTYDPTHHDTLNDEATAYRRRRPWASFAGGHSTGIAVTSISPRDRLQRVCRGLGGIIDYVQN